METKRMCTGKALPILLPLILQGNRLAIFFTFTQELRAAADLPNKSRFKLLLEIDKICKSKPVSKLIRFLGFVLYFNRHFYNCSLYINIFVVYRLLVITA